MVFTGILNNHMVQHWTFNQQNNQSVYQTQFLKTSTVHGCPTFDHGLSMPKEDYAPLHSATHRKNAEDVDQWCHLIMVVRNVIKQALGRDFALHCLNAVHVFFMFHATQSLWRLPNILQLLKYGPLFCKPGRSLLHNVRRRCRARLMPLQEPCHWLKHLFSIENDGHSSAAGNTAILLLLSPCAAPIVGIVDTTDIIGH